jgi:hypothetical protein
MYSVSPSAERVGCIVFLQVLKVGGGLPHPLPLITPVTILPLTPLGFIVLFPVTLSGGPVYLLYYL